tara:strand:+ start:1006 stop:1452 length:447 start_codon:yes stop_codon:yes gene_type:complete
MKKENEERNRPTRGRGRPVGSSRVKLNKIEVEDLLTLSLKEILNNHLSYTEYIQWVKQFNNVSDQQGNTYWLKTWTLLQEKYQLERDQLINKHLNKYWEIYDTAMEVGDLSNARQSLNDITKLLGMAEPERIETKQELKIRFKFGSDE